MKPAIVDEVSEAEQCNKPCDLEWTKGRTEAIISNDEITGDLCGAPFSYLQRLLVVSREGQRGDAGEEEEAQRRRQVRHEADDEAGRSQRSQPGSGQRATVIRAWPESTSTAAGDMI